MRQTMYSGELDGPGAESRWGDLGDLGRRGEVLTDRRGDRDLSLGSSCERLGVLFRPDDVRTVSRGKSAGGLLLGNAAKSAAARKGVARCARVACLGVVGGDSAEIDMERRGREAEGPSWLRGELGPDEVWLARRCGGVAMMAGGRCGRAAHASSSCTEYACVLSCLACQAADHKHAVIKASRHTWPWHHKQGRFYCSFLCSFLTAMQALTGRHR